MEDIYNEVKKRIEKHERSLILTLTKKMAEDLTDYLLGLNLKVKYIVGRAARNENGMVVMYADAITPAIKETVEETKRRRAIQQKYNEEHGITPHTVSKAVQDILVRQQKDAEENEKMQLEVLKKNANLFDPKQRKKLIEALKKEMSDCADRLEYEEAAAIRDQIQEIENTYGKT